MSSETEREEFEHAFAAPLGWRNFTRNDRGYYIADEGRLEAMWKAWFDGRASLRRAAQAAEAGEALSRDAARYRWLRDNEWKDFVSEWMISQSCYGQDPADLDAAIDAALKGNSKE